MACTHRDQIRLPIPSERDKAGAVCPDCMAIGSWWVHLRICLTCGHVGCCDDSPNRHARAHWHASGHPVVSSLEPREIWVWCFVDDVFLRGVERAQDGNDRI
ncbi:MAG TPA: UBP-type zinc finger domain-containing protein [Amaricoccus sp.]|uniref:UBP-type zinc finger domain-containing protein n=1 Tax=Amaricoccus sp. TaxID=1872485 RepID=UPI002B5F5430|nr:UBP-type zinc finger domain-containing protein [Amaricoccus sp.]HMQ92644.1 UBP-type zinc finger domain-containing protein [Amaricoccus sp.]HMR52892.1 UBP-type zinc finger domain-containing protein [Amaricoccus sp.]HMT97741.1 UBP-type zinc finger domain-containing protein [Amaricoccus sp.]